MTDIVLDPITSGYNLSKINKNFDTIEDVINNDVLHVRGGNNTMYQDLDMNSNDILNLPKATSPLSPVRLKEFQDFVAGLIDTDTGAAAALRFQLAQQNDPTYGAGMIGYKNRTVWDKLEDNVSVEDYDSLKDALLTGKRVFIPKDYPPIQISAADSPSILSRVDMIDAEGPRTLTLDGTVHTTTSGNIINVSSKNSNLTIVGQTPAQTSITSVASVTGTPGNYTVVYNVADASNISVGNYIKLDNVVPLLTLSGDNSFYRPRIASNELLRTSAILGNVTSSTGGGSVSWASILSGFVLSDIVNVGDLITIKGQTLPISAISAPPSLTATVSGAWSLGSSSTRDYFVSKPNTGTVGTGGVSSTTVTGVSSAFLTEANVGDILLAAGNWVVITAVNSNTGLTVSPAVNLPASTPYSIITAGVTHDGTHEVLAVSGNQVTARNKWQGTFPPAVNRVSGGEVKVLKTVLKNTGTGNGINFEEGASLAWVNNLVLTTSSASLGTHGIALNGYSPEGPTQIGPTGTMSCGDGVAVVGWGRGAFLGLGCQLQARRSHFCGNLSFAIWGLEGCILALREAVISGNVSRGVYLNAATTSLITDIQVAGNSGDGYTQLEGGVTYGEIPNFYGNTGMNVRITATAGFHVNEGVNSLSGLSGLFGIQAKADLSRCLFVGNARENIEVLNSCDVVATEVTTSGSRGTTGSGRGISNTDSRILATSMNAVGNAGSSVYNTGTLAVFEAPSSWIRGTAAGGITTTVMARSLLTNSRVEAVTATLGGQVLINGVSPVPALTGPVRINEWTNDGSIVFDGAGTGFGVSSLRVNGVAVQPPTFFAKATQVFDFPSIAAGGRQTTNVTVTGALTSGHTASVNSNSVPAGVLLSALITSADTVTVTAYNSTAGALDPGNATLTVTVIG